MRDTSQRRSRRGFLGALAVAAVTTAGCSSLGGTQNSQPGDAGAGGAAETSEETPTQADSGAHHDDAHGHTHADGSHNHDGEHAGSDDEAASAADTELAAFESHLRKWFVDIDSLAVEDSRIRLTYVTKSTRGHELAAGIETVVVSFIQAYTDDWGVEGLDAEVIEPSGEVMGYWRTESRWVEPVTEGHETRTALLERTLDTYHGRLTRDHDHAGADHSENGTHHDNETEHADH
ncbi:twin-arginine translocation signal domain-containing protein [Haloarcula rubripromontorii]|uniref:Twin-arginine translocation signal domain-containing protein n=1 Tax=Haloarcula rubripromontorii TaxID=1705562 RepID=A0A847U569_9EURY|nr:twin-arginine translocation signal domain-containing protein [Haloarcula rubripromontorii]NLV07776.1 twin-arginine translocation signal domain-containing protein [Haloarcula rubripromontorii]